MRRVVVGELMDEPGVDPAELDRALAYIRTVNRRLGGVSALLSHLERWSARWPTGATISLLDVATGSADLPLAARRWAAERGFDLRVTATDKHAETLALARQHAAHDPGVTLVEGDALHLEDQFGPASFDYVHAGLFLHHLPTALVTPMLRGMHRVARRGIVWNDLVRSRVGHAVITVATLGEPRMIRHDARASVRAGFTRAEATMHAHAAGIAYGAYAWNLFTHRFTVAGEKPDADRPAG